MMYTSTPVFPLALVVLRWHVRGSSPVMAATLTFGRGSWKDKQLRRLRHRWKNNIRGGSKWNSVCEDLNWIQLSEDRIQFCDHVNMLTNWLYRVSQEECARLREGVPYVKVYRYNPKHLCPKLNGNGDKGQRKVLSSGGSTHCACQLTILSMSVLECGIILRQFISRSL